LKILEKVISVKEEKEKENTKTIQVQNHTLFIEKEEKKKTIKKNGELYILNKKPIARYTLFVGDFLEKSPQFHKLLNELWKGENKDKLDIFIHSHGGYVTEGMQLYQIMQNNFKGRSTTILHTMGYSMGALLFCMGDKRVVFPDSEIMFHNYSGGVYGKGGEIDARHTFTQKRLKEFFHKIVVKPGFLTQNEFDKMLIGQDYWFDAIEMLKRKIATHILIDGKLIKAKKYLKK